MVWNQGGIFRISRPIYTICISIHLQGEDGLAYRIPGECQPSPDDKLRPRCVCSDPGCCSGTVLEKNSMSTKILWLASEMRSGGVGVETGLGIDHFFFLTECSKMFIPCVPMRGTLLVSNILCNDN